MVRANVTMGLLLAVLHLSCRKGDAAPDELASSPEPVPSGARSDTLIRTGYYQIRVSGAQDCSIHQRHAPAGNTRRVGVEVWLEPTSSVQVPANPYYAKLIDGDGTVYEASLGGCGAALAPSLPAHGKPARGWVVFEVPRSARDFTLTYTPELAGATQAELAVELGPRVR